MKYKHFLEGNSIYFREVRKSDVNEKYYTWMNDPEITKYLESRFFPQSMDSILSYVCNLDGRRDEPFFAICLKETDEHIGNVKLGPINWFNRTAAIGILIGEKKYWGKGIATEAIHLIVTFAFCTLGLNKLSAGCYEENIGSKKAFEKNGFKQEGYLEGIAFHGGKELNGFILGLRATVFFSNRKE